MAENTLVDKDLRCYHCGEKCAQKKVEFDDKSFCCRGCVNVYQILNAHDLDNYYCLNETPGKTVDDIPTDKFRFLDDDATIEKLLTFRNKSQEQVQFYLPQIHCSSCLWLLEHLSSVHEGIIHSRVNFTTKTVTITYLSEKLTLRKVAELLTSIGYEPHIDFQPENRISDKQNLKNAYIKIGVVGFCFSNIMLISFPEYVGMKHAENQFLSSFFKWTNLLLSLPVVFYGSKEFFVNAVYSFRQKYLNIDAPIALAIAVTFLRSVYEVVTQTGAGYFDSMSGIVFFMLVGRLLQNQTYSTLSFSRDYKSYFPIAVKKLTKIGSTSIKIQDIQEHDILMIHHNEVIPTDSLLSKGQALIDYSFITGEEKPEVVEKGGLIYAGGKNAGSMIEIVSVKSFSQNSFIQLWNNDAFDKELSDKDSRTTLISKYFSIVVVFISLAAFTYWMFFDVDTAWKAATAVLIIACPCALLLCASFTNGYLQSMLAKHGFFLKNAATIETAALCDHIAFDKTGTVTETTFQNIHIEKNELNDEELSVVLNLMAQSTHPLSNAIVHFYQYEMDTQSAISIKEIPGQGLESWHNNRYFKIGSRKFVLNFDEKDKHTEVLISIDGKLKAIFTFAAQLREGTYEVISTLSKNYSLSLISGDNEHARTEMEALFPKNSTLKFKCSPEDKLNHIVEVQNTGKKVMMIGDGLNDAGALKQSDVGISVVKNSFSFSPACDIIMEADKFQYLPNYIKTIKKSQSLIIIGFIYSILFNIIGLGFAVTGHLSPLVAAIIMPSSSLGIILISWIGIRRTRNKYMSKITSNH